MDAFQLYLTLICCWSTSIVLSFCPKKREFYSLPTSIWSPDKYLTSYMSLSLALCERTCRQYLECRAYVLQKTSSNNVGTCKLYGRISLEAYSPIGHEELYGMCPIVDHDVHFNNGHWYIIFNNQSLWNDAKVACENVYPNGHLADLNTTDDLTYLTDIASQAGLDLFFTAATRMSGTLDAYIWSNSHNVIPADFLIWDSGEPDNGWDEHFLILDRRTNGNWVWGDIMTGYPKAYICEL